MNYFTDNNLSELGFEKKSQIKDDRWFSHPEIGDLKIQIFPDKKQFIQSLVIVSKELATREIHSQSKIPQYG